MYSTLLYFKFLTATTFNNQHQHSRLQSYQCAECWDGGSFRIFFRILPDLSGPKRDLSGSYPISPVLAESLLISPDLCRPYLIFGSRISPESFRILLDISGFLQIFQVPLMTEHGVKRAWFLNEPTTTKDLILKDIFVTVVSAKCATDPSKLGADPETKTNSHEIQFVNKCATRVQRI